MNTDPMLAAAAQPPVEAGPVMSRRKLLANGLRIAAGIAVVGVASACDHETPPWDPTGIDTGPPPSPEGRGTLSTPKLHEGMQDSSDPGLRILAAHEHEMNRGFDTNMLFTGMPRNPEEAADQAATMAGTLKEYANRGIRPLVMMQPLFGGTEQADLSTINNEQNADVYRETWNSYFQTLKQAGITDEQIGTWVPFPTPNIPAWKDGATDPATFVRNLVPVAQAFKTHFGGDAAKVSVLLNAATYRSGDTNYENGTYEPTALLPYVTGIPSDAGAPPLVDTIGIEGFPWQLTDTAEGYLPAQSALVCASRLGTKNIWLNTGSFSRRKGEDGADVVADINIRLAQLGGALQQANAIKDLGKRGGFKLSVHVNIYAKNDYPQGPDWSYKAPNDVIMIRQGCQAATGNGITTSYFDA